MYNDPVTAKRYAYQFLKKNEADKDWINTINAFNYLGAINSTLSYADSAYYFYNKAIIKAFSINNEQLVLSSKMGKAGFLYQNYDFNNSLALYDEALTLANKLGDKKNKINININIARLKYEIGEYEKAIEVFRKNYKEDISSSGKAILDLYLAKTYLKMKKPDSSLSYIKEGLSYCKTYKDKELEIYFLKEFGTYLISKQEYNEAESVLHQALEKAEEIESQGKKALVMLTFAKLHTEKGEIETSIQVLKSILKTSDKAKFAPEELSDYYKLLAENYKEVDSLAQATFYYQKYFDEENKKASKKFNTIQDLHELDLKKVNKEKDSYLQQKAYLSALVLVLLGLLTLIFFISKRREKINEERFISLMQKIERYENQKIENKKGAKESYAAQKEINEDESLIDNKNLTKVVEKPEDFNDEEDEINTEPGDNQFVIKDEKVMEILENLEKLEKKEYYLRQDFTLHNAAKKLKTNTAYLSKIVNNELGKNFSTYLNELRINYVILELKNNSRLRAYAVNSIAEEIGYKSADSFTKYFKAATGLTPSVYIKKINDMKNKNLHSYDSQ